METESSSARSYPYQSFSNVSDYLVLKPKKASPFDLFQCLWSGKRGDFLEQSTGPEAPDLRSISYRWLVFVSLATQMILLWLQKPMAGVGNSLQLWLNLVQCNGGMFRLFFNCIKGSVAWPDKSSSTYRSVVGFLDKRFDLDEISRPGNQRFLPQLSVMACKLSYESSSFVENVVKNQWKMKYLGFYDCWNDFEGRNTTQAFMCSNPSTNLILVAFRGTEPFDAYDWCTDVDFSWYEINNLGNGKVHAGFMKALGQQKNTGWPKQIIDHDPITAKFAYYTIRDNLRKLVKNDPSAKVVLTGHSLGGALAVLFVAVLLLHDEEELLQRLEGVYTYGQPRVGDDGFGKFMKGNLAKYHIRYDRYVYCNDMVPRMPRDDALILFKHFGPCLYFDSLYSGKILPEEPNRNYLSLLWVIPKYVNAWWELIRGQTYLPWLNGSNYKENWALTFYRVVGLLIPGLTAHALQDYQNLTSLGTIIVSNHQSKRDHEHTPIGHIIKTE